MHLFPLLPVLSLLLGTRASSHNPREPVLHRLDVRDPFVDVCASIAVGEIGQFTCQKVVPVSLKQNQQSYAYVCRAFLTSSRRTLPPSPPLMIPGHLR